MGAMIIGVTGGVGCGKSSVLQSLAEMVDCRIEKADELSHKVMEPGGPAYDDILRELMRCGGPQGLTQPDGSIHRTEMARRIFENEELRQDINDILHPAVIRTLHEMIREERASDAHEFFFLEAALLIETGFGRVVDEMWLVDCPAPIRRQRLKDSRGYTDEKIDAIMAAQLSDEAFRAGCRRIIDNSGTPQETIASMKQAIDGARASLRADRRGESN